LLATNPNLFVSKTRLSIRGIPLTITDAQLKREAKYSVIKFWRQVNAGNRESLASEELDGLENGIKVEILQAKLLRDVRLDPITKKPRSKGMGFVEFQRHADAISCLRYLNFNPKAFTHESNIQKVDVDKPITVKTKKNVVTEFAIENRLVLKKRDERNKSKRPAENDSGSKKKAKVNKVLFY
jgi:nucleolar protein 4